MMKHSLRRILSFSASMLLTMTTGTALAGEPLVQPALPDAGVTPQPAAEPFASPFSDGSEVTTDTLSRLRGGTDIVTNDQVLSGTVGSNVATNIATGGNTITAGAFANVAGIPIVIQNSGANVLIQNATIINLQMQ